MCAYFPPQGSTVAFQSDPTRLVATVSVVSHSPQSVAALQGTNPWIVGNSSVQVIGVMPTQSVMAIPGIGVLGSVAVLQGTQPWLTQIVTSVATRPTPASVQLIGGNALIGSVAQAGNWFMQPASVQVLAGTNPIGSVATLQGTNPWIIAFPNASIAGTYAEDAAHSGGERGLFTLGVRNDAVASFTSANLDYGPVGTDSAGRTLTKPFAPEESRVYGVASTVNTAASSLIAAGGVGLRNYITDLWIANTGSVATLVSFRDIDASIIGKTIAPAGGGSNIIALATPMRTHALNSQIEYTANVAVSILHVTAFGFTAP